MNLQGNSMECKASATTLKAKEVGQMLRPRPTDAHKGTMGHALLVAGSQGMAGAAILACQSCLRSGLGKLTLHTAQANNIILQCSVPEAILHLDENEKMVSHSISTKVFQAVGIGPGLGTEEQTAEALHQYMLTCEAPLVLDADALNIISTHPQWRKDIPEGTILTPHAGEFQRLTQKNDQPEERLQIALDYAQENQVYMVMKGHPSIVVTPEQDTFLCPYGNSGMATPGSGDVLTGIITGLLAQGYQPKEATILGVWLHALAGDYASQELGEECMLASDIISHLPQAFKKLKTKNEEE